MNTAYQEKTKELIDGLKNVCANYGLGNDGNEYKIIVQMFQYKLMNDKFIRDIKAIDPALGNAENLYEQLAAYPPDKYEKLMMQIGANTAVLKPEHLLTALYKKQDTPNFHTIMDDTLRDIAAQNSSIFSVQTAGGSIQIPVEFRKLKALFNPKFGIPPRLGFELRIVKYSKCP